MHHSAYEILEKSRSQVCVALNMNDWNEDGTKRKSNPYVPLNVSQQYLKAYFSISWRIKGYLPLNVYVFFMWEKESM